MLAPRPIPAHYDDWNRDHGAPRGTLPGRLLRYAMPRFLPVQGWAVRAFGSFSFQKNNDTRRFEYPWVYEQLGDFRGKTVLDIGGSLAGMQFLLAAEGALVTNLDPGLGASGRGWRVDARSLTNMAAATETSIDLIPKKFAEADLPGNSFDLVMSISTVEHIPETELRGLFESVGQVLTPGGLFVLTVDLFLDLHPFTDALVNRWGTNVNLWDLVSRSGLELAVGEPAEIFGHPDFDSASVVTNRDNYVVGEDYPVMIQALVLRRPEVELT